MDEAELARIQGACVEARSVDARSDLLREGCRTEHIVILLEGWACRYRMLADGGRHVTALFVPGDVCNLDHLMVARVDYATAAIGPCTVALISKERLRELLDASLPIRDAFWWMTCVENTVATEWGVSLGGRSARERLAHLFCELLVRLKTVGLATNNTFTLPLTQDDLADATGMSVVHVNRSLQALRAERLLRLVNRQLTVLDWDGLKAAADFRPGYLHLEGLPNRRTATP